MKNLLFLLIALSFACAESRVVTQMTAASTEIITPPTQGDYEARIRNKSGETLQVEVRDRVNNKFRSGFGLGSRSKAKITVTYLDQLVLRNEQGQSTKAVVKFYPIEIVPAKKVSDQSASNPTSVSFILRNNTAKSIPLIIPSVMNPNLSPFSNSGVNLEVGQEILFRANGKRQVLLVVDENIQPGEKIDVAKRIKERKKELGISD